MKIKETIEKELEGLEDFVVAVTVTPESYTSTNIAILNYLVNTKRMDGIYISMNKPYFTLANILKRDGINTNKLFFIDAISSNISQESEADNCVFLQSPAALGELGIAVLNLCETGNAKFLLLDSLSTMAIYNDISDCIKYSHQLITQLRIHRLVGVIISLEKEMEDTFTKDVSMFVDKVIYLK